MSPKQFVSFLFCAKRRDAVVDQHLQQLESGCWGETRGERGPPSKEGTDTTWGWDREWGRVLSQDPNTEPTVDAFQAV